MDKEKIQDAIDLLEEALEDGEKKDYSVEAQVAIEAARTLKKWCKKRDDNCFGCVFCKNEMFSSCELKYWEPKAWDI